MRNSSGSGCTGGTGRRRTSRIPTRASRRTGHVVAQSSDNRRWIVVPIQADQPVAYHLFDRPQRAVRELFSVAPDLAGAPLRPMHPLTLRSRDGLELVSYLTLPADRRPRLRPAKPLPIVLFVHGGPWWRGYLGVNADAPVARQPRLRGARGQLSAVRPGTARAFVNAGDTEWGGKMHDDLIDA